MSETTHNIPIGALVEVSCESSPHQGVRLFVTEHTTDWLGEHSYSIGFKNKTCGYRFLESELKIIKI